VDECCLQILPGAEEDFMEHEEDFGYDAGSDPLQGVGPIGTATTTTTTTTTIITVYGLPHLEGLATTTTTGRKGDSPPLVLVQEAHPST